MKMLKIAATGVLIGVLVLSAVVAAQKTSFDFDRSVEFSKFRTYAWKNGTPAGEPFLDKRIVSAIDSQLVAKSLTKTDTNPDVYVRYHTGVGLQKSVSGFGTASGSYGPRGGLDTFDARLHEIPVGGLVIDLVDASSHELVWRGVGVDRIDVEAKPERRDAAINKTVAKILKNYPPKSR